MSTQPLGKVVLADKLAASAVLHAVLHQVTDAYPEAIQDAGFPEDPDRFRSSYPEVLPRFEAARVGSSERANIAHRVIAAFRQYLVWEDERGVRPLHETLHESVEPLRLESHSFGAEPGWSPSLLYQGERWKGNRLGQLARELVQRGMMTEAAGGALTWVSDQVIESGALSLTGRKIAVLGGGAEMAPTRFWLEAGAEVLWLDVAPPPPSWMDAPGMAGRLIWPAGNVDLLTRPQEVLATLIAFADGDPVDLGLYAYAPGQARELLLAGTMNAIVDAMPVELLASVTVLVSPTTPTALTKADLAAIEQRFQSRAGWEAALQRLGFMGRGGGRSVVGTGSATRSVVKIQGASYQAAQYLGKILAAESWASPLDGESLRVSANAAAITRTRSLNHPVFAAAFGGAAAFRVETMTPRFSRRLNGLLAVRDWLHPELPVPGEVRVHGGIHTLPYPLDPALRVAAAIGFARSPRLLRGFVGNRAG